MTNTSMQKSNGTQQDYHMTAQEVHDFQQKGYSGPHTLCSPEEMGVILEQANREVFVDKPALGQPIFQSRHLDSPLVWQLCSHPSIVQRMQALFGPDLVLWRSHFFDKQPGGLEVPWHQDLNYWPLEPVINISAWVAITEAVVDNSCVQIIPGSHRTIVPHVPATAEQAFGEQADPSRIDLSKAIPMILKPGQFFLFTERLLHYSKANTSNKRRLGLAVRVTVPFVRVEHEKLFKGHKCIQLAGNDPMGFNEMTSPPQAV